MKVAQALHLFISTFWKRTTMRSILCVMCLYVSMDLDAYLIGQENLTAESANVRYGFYELPNSKLYMDSPSRLFGEYIAQIEGGKFVCRYFARKHLFSKAIRPTGEPIHGVRRLAGAYGHDGNRLWLAYFHNFDHKNSMQPSYRTVYTLSIPSELLTDFLKQDGDEQFERRVVESQFWHFAPLHCFFYWLGTIDLTNQSVARSINSNEQCVKLEFDPVVFLQNGPNTRCFALTPRKNENSKRAIVDEFSFQFQIDQSDFCVKHIRFSVGAVFGGWDEFFPTSFDVIRHDNFHGNFDDAMFSVDYYCDQKTRHFKWEDMEWEDIK